MAKQATAAKPEAPAKLEKDSKLEAIKAFKDWSNYLLVTTIAALGWVVGSTAAPPANVPHPTYLNGLLLEIEIFLLAFSAIAGVLTLALVPIVTEKINDTTESIYKITAPYQLIYMWGKVFHAKLKYVCWPQHFLLILAILLHAIRSLL
jgi:hypothetical protein